MVYFIVCVNSGRLHFKIILRPFHRNHVLTFKLKSKLEMINREMFYLKGSSKVDGRRVKVDARRSEAKRSVKLKNAKNIVLHCLCQLVKAPFKNYITTVSCTPSLNFVVTYVSQNS